MNYELRIKVSLVSFSLILASLFLIPTVSAQDESSPSGTDAVRDKVRKTIENLIKKPKAVIGTLDSVTDSTLKIKTSSAIKTDDGKFVLVATNKDTKYIKTIKGKQAEVKFVDLAIGDFIAALGYKNGDDILGAQRVLAFDETPFLQKQVVYGKVETNKKGVLTIKHLKTAEVWTVETSVKTEIVKRLDGKIEAKEIEEGDRIVAVGTLNAKKDKTLVATLVQVIPGSKGTPRPTVSPSPSPKASAKPSPKPSPTSQP
ncbi:MAG: Uncharacterized protein G01um10145_557 [Microgenomates group bacterium Gr01-1014_5]|nr:MAG: Uncharacterized protein G01um10145_557 [Microgenomates group bacterium Gr01-1014_5]